MATTDPSTRPIHRSATGSRANRGGISRRQASRASSWTGVYSPPVHSSQSAAMTARNSSRVAWSVTGTISSSAGGGSSRGTSARSTAIAGAFPSRLRPARARRDPRSGGVSKGDTHHTNPLPAASVAPRRCRRSAGRRPARRTLPPARRSGTCRPPAQPPTRRRRRGAPRPGSPGRGSCSRADRPRSPRSARGPKGPSGASGSGGGHAGVGRARRAARDGRGAGDERGGVLGEAAF